MSLKTGLLLHGLLISFFLITIIMTGHETMADTTHIDGDWYIDVNTTLRDGTWEVSGSIMINNSTLTLVDSNLVVNTSSFISSRIIVHESGHLIAQRSTIEGGKFGISIEVRDDSLLENTTVRSMDRIRLEYGIYHEGGDLVLDNCTFIDGLNIVYSHSDLIVRSCTFSGFDGDAVSWYYQENEVPRGLVIEDTAFRNDQTQGRAMHLEGSFNREPGWNATVRGCTFENLTYCIYVNGFEQYGSLLIEHNIAFTCVNGIELYEVGESTTIRYNSWDVRFDGLGFDIHLRGEGSPIIHNETIKGGRFGIQIMGQHQFSELRNITITDTWGQALSVYMVYMDVHGAYFRTHGRNMVLRGPTYIHLYDCDTEHSGIIYGTGEILELKKIEITSVAWQEGTPITEGTVVFETEDGVHLVTWNNTTVAPLEFPLLILRRNMDQTCRC